jgi:hypothetical protein
MLRGKDRGGDEMAQGLILLAFLAVLFAVLATRVRRRMGLGSSGRVLLALVAGFAVAVLALWAFSTH